MCLPRTSSLQPEYNRLIFNFSLVHVIQTFSFSFLFFLIYILHVTEGTQNKISDFQKDIETFVRRPLERTSAVVLQNLPPRGQTKEGLLGSSRPIRVDHTKFSFKSGNKTKHGFKTGKFEITFLQI